MNKNKTIDKFFVLILILILISSMTVLYSATLKSKALGLAEFYWARQCVWLSLGVILMFFIAYTDYRKVGILSWFIYLSGLLLLMSVLLFGRKISGSQRWLHWGPVTIQPSEFMKIIYIISLAWYLDTIRGHSFSWKNLFISGLITFFPMIFIALEPDLGTALVFVPIFMGMIFTFGAPWKHFLGLGFLAGLALPFMWFIFLKNYQKQRILMFLNPQNDQFGSGWTVIQSKIAIGSGRFWGKGITKGSQTQLDFLPEHHTDFIFSVLAEEWGFIGVAFIFILFFLLISKCILIANKTYDSFGQQLVIGSSILLSFQMLVNIGMTLGLCPVTGLPLPFFSYGGSSLVSILTAMGFILSVDRHKD
ncbi:rod shape-determining protein RodA [PVC group bacterium (ex Bugula neritina AB1)]|nr:rod shape-determining protein RodA [PVC group bacterium (ex Bugula neritina AB1)]